MSVSVVRSALEVSVSDGRVLERVALALNSTLSLREVLRELAALTREITAAGRVTLFTWQDGRLEPAIALAPEPDEVLWSAFREMGPVRITGAQADVLAQRRALGISDAATDPLVPPEWVRRFRLQSLAVVPLHAAGEPRGVMVVDYPDRRLFTDAELGVLEAIGVYAGLAMRNAATHEQVQRTAGLQGAVARAASGLAWPAEASVLAGRLASAFDELLDTSGSAVWLLERDGATLRLLAPPPSGGSGVAPAQPVSSGLAHHLLVPGPSAAGHCRVVSADQLGGLVGPGWWLLVPLPAESRPAGVALAPVPSPDGVPGEVVEAAGVLAALGGAALERQALLELRERQLRQLATLYGLSATLTERAEPDLLRSRLSELLAPEGLTVTDVVFGRRDLARHLGSEQPTAEEREAWRNGGWTRSGDGRVGVPMRLGSRVVGTLRVRHAAPLDESAASFLEAVAGGVAELSARTALRTALEQAHRERVLAAERDRVAAEAHDTVGAALTLVEGRLRRAADQLPADLPARSDVLAAAALADGGKWQLEQLIRALRFVPGPRRGLAAALRGLARQVQADSGVAVIVDVHGRPARLPGRVERALYRVASEALVSAWRHARCSLIHLDLTFEPAQVLLGVRDDGVALGQRQPELGPELGLQRMRRAVEDVGGRLRFTAATPHGVRVEARVARARG